MIENLKLYEIDVVLLANGNFVLGKRYGFAPSENFLVIFDILFDCL